LIETLNYIIETAKKGKEVAFWFLFCTLFKNSYPNFKIQTLVTFLGNLISFLYNTTVLFVIYHLIDIHKAGCVFLEYIQSSFSSISQQHSQSIKHIGEWIKGTPAKTTNALEDGGKVALFLIIAGFAMFRLKLHDWGFKLSPQKLMAMFFIIGMVILIMVLPKLKLQANTQTES